MDKSGCAFTNRAVYIPVSKVYISIVDVYVHATSPSKMHVGAFNSDIKIYLLQYEACYFEVQSEAC
jgi:hypothetical protein